MGGSPDWDMNPDDWLDARESDSESCSPGAVLRCQYPPATQDALTTRLEGDMPLGLNRAGLSTEGRRKQPRLTSSPPP